MKRKFTLIICILVSIFSTSLLGCNLQDDYILETKENTDESPSNEKVDDIFAGEKMTEFMDKLKSTPGELSDKLDEADSDTESAMKELQDKVDELTDKLNNADLEGKGQDIQDQMDEINDKIDELKDKTTDVKDRAENIENPIDSTKVSDTVDEFKIHIDNLQSTLDRINK